jgi:hypothetical protein
MPGEDSTNIGEYTPAELSAMLPDELIAAQARGFTKPLVAAPGAPERPAAAVAKSPSSAPDPLKQALAAAQQPPASENVWKSRRSGSVFVVPSGQKCLLRELQVEQLLLEGILDQVTRLDGLAQELVNLAQGLPPEKQKLPSKEDFSTLLNLVNKVTLMAVVEPHVHADDSMDFVPQDSVAISDIDLMDRIAILEHALKGVKGLDNFRNAG